MLTLFKKSSQDTGAKLALVHITKPLQEGDTGYNKYKNVRVAVAGEFVGDELHLAVSRYGEDEEKPFVRKNAANKALGKLKGGYLYTKIDILGAPKNGDTFYKYATIIGQEAIRHSHRVHLSNTANDGRQFKH